MSYTCPICKKTYTSLDEVNKCLCNCVQPANLKKRLWEEFEELKALVNKFNELSDKQRYGLKKFNFLDDLEKLCKKIDSNISESNFTEEK